MECQELTLGAGLAGQYSLHIHNFHYDLYPLERAYTISVQGARLWSLDFIDRSEIGLGNTSFLEREAQMSYFRLKALSAMSKILEHSLLGLLAYEHTKGVSAQIRIFGDSKALAGLNTYVLAGIPRANLSEPRREPNITSVNQGILCHA